MIYTERRLYLPRLYPDAGWYTPPNLVYQSEMLMSLVPSPLVVAKPLNPDRLGCMRQVEDTAILLVGQSFLNAIIRVSHLPSLHPTFWFDRRSPMEIKQCLFELVLWLNDNRVACA
jgi:hypothetical protein